MSRARNTTTAPTGSIAPLGLRLLPELRAQIEDAARQHGRSLNAEVTARLQASFDQPSAELPFAVQEAIEIEQEQRGGTPQEALVRLAKLAMANGGTLLSVTMTPGTTVKQLSAMLEASRTIVPPDASIILERE